MSNHIQKKVLISVAINISARDLEDEELAKSLIEHLKTSKLDPSYLEFEITETCLPDDITSAADCLKNLKKLGVRLSIDDFGVGFSSLQYLAEMPVDYLKLDRSFINKLDDEKTQLIVKSTIKLAHELNLMVIAEGVEDIETLNRLENMNCGYAQGYLLSRPVKAKQLRSVIERIESDYNIKSCI